MTAARRYKDITGEVTDAVARMRRHDKERAVQLRTELAELDERLRLAGDRAELSTVVAHLHWESGLEALWGESWMTLRPLPRPDPDASPRELDYLDRLVEQRLRALLDLVRKRPLLGRR